MRTKRILPFVLTLFVLGLSGCATTEHGARNLSDIGRYTSLKQGASTKKDVYISFGQPHDVQYLDDKSSFWRYFQSKTSSNAATYIPLVGLVAGGIDSQTLISTIHFNADDLYIRVNTRDVKKTTNMWSAMSRSSDLRGQDKKSERVVAEMNKLKLPFDEHLAKYMSDVEVLADD